LFVRPVGMAERGDKDAVGIERVDIHRRDHLAVVEADVRPRLAGVGGFVHAVAGRQIGSNDTGARADVDDVRVGRRDRDRPDRAGRLVVEDRGPGRAVVGRAPYAAVVEPDVGDVGLAGRARYGACATGPRWADLAPVHVRIQIG